MLGRRHDIVAPETVWDLLPGDYGRVEDRWWVCLPTGEQVDVSTWTITEHEDRTITVSPSIRLTRQRTGEAPIEIWHGFLEKGVWRSC